MAIHGLDKDLIERKLVKSILWKLRQKKLFEREILFG
jgi:hypothetical protein